MEVNRQIKGCPALDDLDHALGRPHDPFNTYRDHYATSCTDMINVMKASDWWEGPHYSAHNTEERMAFFYVSDAGREALAMELQDVTKYGRTYSVSRDQYPGEMLVNARSRSAARYAAYCQADVDWSFMEFCEGLRVRLAAPPSGYVARGK